MKVFRVLRFLTLIDNRRRLRQDRSDIRRGQTALGEVDKDTITWCADMRITFQHGEALFGNMIGLIDLNGTGVPNRRWVDIIVPTRVGWLSSDGSASASKFNSTLACTLNDRTLSGLRQCIPLSFIFN